MIKILLQRVISKSPFTKQQLPPLLLCLIFFPHIAHANQPNPFENDSNIKTIAQDNDDLIWLAGQNGLVRFDGENIVNFSTNNKKWPLPSNWIHQITQKDEQFILATERSGLLEFDPKTGVIKKINMVGQTNTFYSALYHQGLYYALNVGSDSIYSYDPIKSETKIIAEHIDNEHLFNTLKNVYFTNNKELYQIQEGKTVKVIAGKVNAVASIEDTAIIAMDKQLYLINDQGVTRNIAISEKITIIIPAKNEDNFFTISDDGSLKKYSINTLSPIPHHYPSLANKQIKSALHDNSGVLWLVTSLGVIKLTESNITKHPIDLDIRNSWIELAQIEDQLLIGTNGLGIREFDLTTNSLSPLVQNNEIPLKGAAARITDLLIIDDDIFIGTFDGFWRYSINKNALKRINLPLKSNIIIKLYQKDDILYIATNASGLIIYNWKTSKIVNHIDDSFTLSSTEVIDVLALNNGDVWLATANGIDVYHPNNQSLRNLGKLGPSKVLSLATTNGKVFATTKGDGIFVYNDKGELLSKMAEGINFNYMTVIENEIWASARPGLYKINPKTYQVTMIPNTEIFSFTDAPLKSDDSIYIGSFSGFIEVPIKNSASFHPKVIISKTTVSGQAHLLNKSIKVKSANDVINLELASLDYRSGQNKHYKYQINNGRWNTINGNQLTLTGLASGAYDIEIMATNSLGQWSNNKAYTEINVAYPWYWTPKIRVIYAVTILCFVFISFWLLYLRAKSIGNIHQLLKSDIKSRGKKALNVSRNIALALEYIQEQEFDRNKIKIVLKQSIDELSNVNMTKEPDSLYGNSLVIALAFLSEFIHKKYHINVVNQNDIKEENLSYELQSDIYKIVYEAITSAILNSNGRNFKVTLQEFKDKIWLTISDDSHSFVNFNSKINFDMAMYYIRQIALKYKASVNTFDEQDKGSQLVISIPLMSVS